MEQTKIELELISIEAAADQLRELSRHNSSANGKDLVELRQKVKSILGELVIDEVGDLKPNIEGLELKKKTLSRQDMQLRVRLAVVARESKEIRAQEFQDDALNIDRAKTSIV